MDDRSAVRCMRHCSSDLNIFYVDFPQYCPICGGEMKRSFLLVPPFCVPHPFMSSFQAPYSVVVKPTEGCFLNDYHSGQNLHIGITTSTGLTYNYNESGVHVDELGWSLCVASSVADILKSKTGSCNIDVQNWDDKLRKHSVKPDWSQEKYEPFSHNCYNFVLSFLNSLVPDRHFQTKEVFCKDYIVPITTRAAQYIDLRRRIFNKGPLVMEAHMVEVNIG